MYDARMHLPAHPWMYLHISCQIVDPKLIFSVRFYLLNVETTNLDRS
jgi:hypothetical protein